MEDVLGGGLELAGVIVLGWDYVVCELESGWKGLGALFKVLI
jgi:hypothetical protein